MSTHNHPSIARAIYSAIGAITLGLMIAAPADAGALFQWDVSKIGLNGAAFTADALKATEVSRIKFGNLGNFEEHGYAQITGILNNGVFSTPPGLGSDYTLYVKFDAEGNNVLNLTSATENFFAVNGVSVFGIDSNNDAFVDNGSNSPVSLATGNLISGFVGLNGNDLFAKVLTTFIPTAAGEDVFLQPQPFPRLFFSDFYHSASEPGGITQVADGFVLNGGNDTLSFVPEPATLMLFVLGLPVLLFGRRRAR